MEKRWYNAMQNSLSAAKIKLDDHELQTLYELLEVEKPFTSIAQLHDTIKVLKQTRVIKDNLNRVALIDLLNNFIAKLEHESKVAATLNDHTLNFLQNISNEEFLSTEELTKTDLDPQHVLYLDTETTGLQCSYLEKQGVKYVKDEIIQLALYNPMKNEKYLFYTNPSELVKFPALSWDLDSLLKAFDHPVGELKPEHQQRLIKDAFSSNSEFKPVFHNDPNIIIKKLARKDFAMEVAKLINHKTVVMHNGINFDAKLLRILFDDAHVVSYNFNVLDTKRLAATYWSHAGHKSDQATNFVDAALQNNRQRTLGEYYHVENEDSHDAYGDTMQLYGIYQAMYNDLKETLHTKTITLPILNNYQALLTVNEQAQQRKEATLKDLAHENLTAAEYDLVSKAIKQRN